MSNNISITQSISGTGAIRIAGASQTTHRVFALDVCSGRLGSEILNTAVWIHKGQFDGLRKMLKLITKPVPQQADEFSTIPNQLDQREILHITMSLSPLLLLEELKQPTSNRCQYS
ncbi:Protein of unknown function [Pyronema omphalodes CBS 100304]|uniref:Uncharacterized protein n=1 Tax=Pyronema omphalodes (strain CBS 100304) TaxID=1076935 RepID=U4L7H8_PYROM|nr:Protein of unknown function [Pyronema omphalodes CBS 100304]